jgi:hypothetical protein
MNGLTQNAFFFLRGAFQQLENDPKRSVIDFYAAVELFLKARLLAEHWSLIVASKPDLQQFKSGDFQSVTFNEAIERFQRVLDQPIPVDAVKAFDRVRKHRNRMVHFYHPEENPSAPSVIAIEQLKAWHHLNRLITGDWAPKLPIGSALKAMSVERNLTPHVKYAEQRFHHIKAELEAEKSEGTKFSTCTFCSIPAAAQTDERPWLRILDCRVCGSRRPEMDFACPNCQVIGALHSDESYRCQSCNHVVELDDFYEALDQDLTPFDEYMEADTPASCDECQAYQSVCKHQDDYLCTACLSVFDAVYACGWCGALGTKQRENSEWTGCEHCEGKAGYIRDE